MLTARADVTYAPVDEADAGSHRPDLSILLYPVATMADPHVHTGSRRELLGEAPTPEAIDRYSLERMNWTGCPPTFLLHAMDDASVPVANSLQLLAALRAAGVTIGEVRTSAWCRCRDTAQLAFGRHERWSALNSFFDDRAAEPGSTAELRAFVAAHRGGSVPMMVTHQVNITAATGLYAGFGQIVAVPAEGGTAFALAPVG